MVSKRGRKGHIISKFPSGHLGVELFPPHSLSGIVRSGIGGNHVTHHLLPAAARHLDMLDGERNLASKQLRRL